MNGRRSERRAKLFIFQQAKCANCFRECTLEKPTKKRRMFTVDHVIPKRLGGTNAWRNLVGLCIGCNLKKGGQMPSAKLLHFVAKREHPMTDAREKTTK